MFQAILHKANMAKQVLWGRFSLRKCTSVGKLPRLNGCVIIENHGAIKIGEKLRLHARQIPIELASQPGGELIIGDKVGINSGASICAQKSVIIGDRCMIGNYCLIMDTDFHMADDHDAIPEASPVVIENDVWLAARVTVLKGVTIGEGAVVSAGSVVAMNIPPYTMAGGVPARAIRKLANPKDNTAETAQL